MERDGGEGRWIGVGVEGRVERGKVERGGWRGEGGEGRVEWRGRGEGGVEEGGEGVGGRVEARGEKRTLVEGMVAGWGRDGGHDM